ncbi:hypothetical protein OAT67_03810 [Bacteriovoracaceae bacterium]|nr:hypothetical protein [Bacteriovoracaceae bacterium]
MSEAVFLIIPMVLLLLKSFITDKIGKLNYDVIIVFTALIMFILSIFTSGTYLIENSLLKIISLSYELSYTTTLSGLVGFLVLSQLKYINSITSALVLLMNYVIGINSILFLLIAYFIIKIYEEKTLKNIASLVVLNIAITLYFSHTDLAVSIIGILVLFRLVFEKSVGETIFLTLMTIGLLEVQSMPSLYMLYFLAFLSCGYKINNISKAKSLKDMRRIMFFIFISIGLVMSVMIDINFLTMLMFLLIITLIDDSYEILKYGKDIRISLAVNHIVVILLLGAVVKNLSYVIEKDSGNLGLWLISILFVLLINLLLSRKYLDPRKIYCGVTASQVFLLCISCMIYSSSYYGNIEKSTVLSYNVPFLISVTSLIISSYFLFFILVKDSKKIQYIEMIVSKLNIKTSSSNSRLIYIKKNMNQTNQNFNNFIKSPSQLLELIGIYKNDSLIFFIISLMMIFFALVRIQSIGEL